MKLRLCVWHDEPVCSACGVVNEARRLSEVLDFEFTPKGEQPKAIRDAIFSALSRGLHVTVDRK
jgi:hypothetical protein